MNYRLNSKRMDYIFKKKKKSPFKNKIFENFKLSLSTQQSLLRGSRVITFSFHEPHSTTSIIKQKLKRERLHVNRDDRFPRSQAKSSCHGAR